MELRKHKEQREWGDDGWDVDGVERGFSINKGVRGEKEERRARIDVCFRDEPWSLGGHCAEHKCVCPATEWNEKGRECRSARRSDCCNTYDDCPLS